MLPLWSFRDVFCIFWHSNNPKNRRWKRIKRDGGSDESHSHTRSGHFGASKTRKKRGLFFRSGCALKWFVALCRWNRGSETAQLVSHNSEGKKGWVVGPGSHTAGQKHSRLTHHPAAAAQVFLYFIKTSQGDGGAGHNSPLSARTSGARRFSSSRPRQVYDWRLIWFPCLSPFSHTRSFSHTEHKHVKRADAQTRAGCAQRAKKSARNSASLCACTAAWGRRGFCGLFKKKEKKKKLVAFMRNLENVSAILVSQYFKTF